MTLSIQRVQGTLRQIAAPVGLDFLLHELGCDPTNKSSRQRIHYLAYAKKVVSVPDPADPSRRLYSWPPEQRDVMSEPEPNPLSSISVPVPPAAPTVDLSHAVGTIAQAVATTLEAAIKDRIADVVRTQLQQALDALPAQVIAMTGGKAEKLSAPALAPAPAPAPRVRKPRVTVVGLLPGQVEMISREYAGQLEMHFVGNEHSSVKRLEGLCRSSQHVLTMTGFISHSTEALIKASGGQLQRVSGGMTSLRGALHEIVEEVTT